MGEIMLSATKAIETTEKFANILFLRGPSKVTPKGK